MRTSRLRHPFAFAISISAGCGAPLPFVSTEQPSVTSPIAEVEAERTRHRVVAEGIEVYATLWDAAMLSALDAQRPTTTGALDAERSRWTALYVDQTSFTVAFDIADRPPIARPGDDGLAELGAWGFALQRNDGALEAPTTVELLGLDRFPTPSGEHHVRMVARVHFASSRPNVPSTLRLWIRARARLGPRFALGQPMAKRGTALQWDLVPAPHGPPSRS